MLERRKKSLNKTLKHATYYACIKLNYYHLKTGHLSILPNAIFFFFFFFFVSDYFKMWAYLKNHGKPML